MIALLIMVGSIAYVVVGYFVAGWVQANTTAAVVAFDEAYYLTHPDEYEALRREEREFGILLGMFWPVAVPGHWLVMHIVYWPQIREAEAERKWRA